MDLIQAFKEAEKQLPLRPKPAIAPITVIDTVKLKKVSKPEPLKPIFENDDFVERVAILIESGGYYPDVAHQLALEEVGGEQLDLWKYYFGRLETAIPTEGGELLKVLITFLNRPEVAMAAFYGWNDVEVFGIFNGPQRALQRRYDAMGLFPALAWSRIGAKLADLDEDRAIIKTRSGNSLKWQRGMTGQRFAVPVWDMSF